ncbi:hypothetical protein M3P05_17045 [Sansalvadorimonas sp. 2012CJ34-2]|uniref:Uncharacterized protein n=1 Tax=Parendozoicomonas callyspongiae TaxID=2942213 RepID=A0ABT0PK24_9GAMM|nr:hypothetical protein [Sansalvadorimonas sp. 2012CJ34-2]MCL6271626.1 hypothetical protein [Sansalvadorimonas sp. 2012CJ34-2]
MIELKIIRVRTQPTPKDESRFINETEKKIPNPGVNSTRGKHIAQRHASEWLNYGNPDDWDVEFESAVLNTVDNLKIGQMKPSDMIEHFEKVRYTIAHKRKNADTYEFGLRRDTIPCSSPLEIHSYTQIIPSELTYGYALERAITIPYDGKHFIESQSNNGKYWADNSFYKREKQGPLRYGLVQGFINGDPIPLTQYVYCSRTEKHRLYESEKWFSELEVDYIGDNKESAIWLHTGADQIPVVLKHIQELIDKAVAGDLTVIPRIHWWYVHLTPVCRGSGGIAEMLTNTLCRLNGVDLPRWKDGVAPSVETLLEPNEEKFCENYHKLFASEDSLNNLFTSPLNLK